MSNKDIIRQLRLATSLLELHEESTFKVRSYQNAVMALERLDKSIDELSENEIQQINGVGKSLASSIIEIVNTGSFKQLEDLLEQTPKGVLQIMDLKGLGPKKVRQIWKDLEIESIDDLLTACDNDKIAKAKGFGAKTQENIKQAILYNQSNKGKLRYANVIPFVDFVEKELQSAFPNSKVVVAGDFRRKLEIIDKLTFLVAHLSPHQIFDSLNSKDGLSQKLEHSGPFVWRGVLSEIDMPLEVYVCKPDYFYNSLLQLTGSDKHLKAVIGDNSCLLKIAQGEPLQSEEDAYEKAGLGFIQPELREGTFEFEVAKEGKTLKLVTYEDIKGILHNHSTYSDGKDSLREMAEYCKELGFAYLGISDHSRTAFYAGGLEIERVKQQHEEIDTLNKELAPFKIFKGIESDILPDGNLDYPTDVLASFDFIVASIHANLSMSVEKATQRLITAIQNPFTTILGHPTGRLLLRREGYPIDHKKVIDACAEHQVIIEINANPYRLDLDWRWVNYALEKGVLLSINPDAHEKAGYFDMHYGVNIGRKGGLTAEMTFNCKGIEEVSTYFAERKKKALKEI